MERKDKERRIIYIAPFILRSLSDMDHTDLPANYTIYLPFFVSVHQMASPLTEVADMQLQLTTHLSTFKG